MTDQERIYRAGLLESLTKHEGWEYVLKHIFEECNDIVTETLKTMRFNPEMMTVDRGFIQSGRINALMDFKDWVEKEIRYGK